MSLNNHIFKNIFQLIYFNHTLILNLIHINLILDLNEL